MIQHPSKSVSGHICALAPRVIFVRRKKILKVENIRKCAKNTLKAARIISFLVLSAPKNLQDTDLNIRGERVWSRIVS